MSTTLRLLMVDDSPGDLLLTRKVIERAQRSRGDDSLLELTSADTMAHAASILEHAQFDCILLDLHLPDGRGTGNLHRVHALAPNVPIVVLTGSDGPETEREVLGAGAAALIRKMPLQHTVDILAVVREAIRSNPNRSPA